MPIQAGTGFPLFHALDWTALLLIIGLALTASSAWWEGRFYWFISLVHQVTVVGWLLSLPFGKLRPLQRMPAPALAR